jgi:hypothetical protein
LGTDCWSNKLVPLACIDGHLIFLENVKRQSLQWEWEVSGLRDQQLEYAKHRGREPLSRKASKSVAKSVKHYATTLWTKKYKE